MKSKLILRTILIPLIGFFVLLLIVWQVQTYITLENQKENSKVKLEIAKNRIIDNKVEESKDWESFDSFMQSKADLITMTIDEQGEGARTRENLNDILGKWGLEGIYICGDEIISAGRIPLTDHTIEKFRSGKTFDTDKENGVCFYASYLKDGTLVIIAQDNASMLQSEEYLISVSNALSTIKVGTEGYVVAYERAEESEEISPSYVPGGSDFTSEAAITDISGLEDGYVGWFNLSGQSYYISVQDVDNTRLIAVVTGGEITHFVQRSITIAALIFGVVLALLTLYLIFLNGDIRKKRVGKKDIKGKSKAVIGVGLVFILVASFYVWVLSAVSDAKDKLSDKLESVENIILQNDEKSNIIVETYEDEYLNRAKRIAVMLKDCPTLLNNEKLVELARRGKLSSIYVFDSEGRVSFTNTVFTDFTLSTDPSTQSYEFWNIVKGYDDYIIQDLMEDDTVKHNLVQYIGVKRLDEKGMVQIGVSPERLQERLYGDHLEDVLDNIAVEDGGFIYAQEVTEDTPESHLGFSSYKDKSGISMSRIMVGDNIVVWKPLDVVIKDGIIISLIITGLCLVIMLALFGSVISILVRELPEDEEESTISGAASRLAHVNTPWKDLEAQGKLSRLIFIVFALFVLGMIIAVNVAGDPDNNIISYILSGEWDHSLSLFSVTYVLIIAMEVIFFTTVARKLILMFSVGYGPRAETFGRLFNSVIKYVTLIGTVFYALNLFGVDTTTLLATAGLLTLGISLGAQSLISDIIAGLFIVFEGDFRVGDIVTIDTFRGTVREIGIRTTKVESPGKDLKIYRNSTIANVINMTKQYSFAAVDCGIEYGESIERVEAILKKELPGVKDRLPSIVDGPFYKGVSELGDSSVVIRVMAQCHESDRIQLTRDLNREIKIIFDRNNIGIPFPQIVLNQPEAKKAATQKEKMDAKEFVEEQKILSKDLEENEEEN